MSGPIELKVSAATIATAVSGLAVWALQTYWFRGEVPLPVAAAVQAVVPAVVAFIAGYLARHTPRTDLQVDPVDVAAAEEGGAHTLDGVGRGDAPEMPVSLFEKPTATRHDGDR